MPRMACPLERSTLVIGSDRGRGSEHVSVAELVCTSCKKNQSARLTAISTSMRVECEDRLCWSELLQ
jgi:hypothetical protein